MKKLIILLVCVFSSIFLFCRLGLASSSPLASIPNPVGSWQTIDDVTNTKRSIVYIQLNEQNQLVGKLIKINFRPGEGPNDLCVRCSGNLHNKKILGMTILTGLAQNPENPLEWLGGKIVDPESGRRYSCKILLSADGKTMKVRGYLGFSFIGRTQIWYRL
ncbi:MAG: DUF2147 domain-containing protein [Legionellales bacterium]|nr:DUF2147 domain-containing protein [Legionellales bacterium]